MLVNLLATNKTKVIKAKTQGIKNKYFANFCTKLTTKVTSVIVIYSQDVFSGDPLHMKNMETLERNTIIFIPFKGKKPHHAILFGVDGSDEENKKISIK